jgi:hypothetical protein
MTMDQPPAFKQLIGCSRDLVVHLVLRCLDGLLHLSSLRVQGRAADMHLFTWGTASCGSLWSACETPAEDGVGLLEQRQDFFRHPAHDHAFASALWTGPARRAAVTDPADENVHE